jgi:hypothetical protein
MQAINEYSENHSNNEDNDFSIGFNYEDPTTPTPSHSLHTLMSIPMSMPMPTSMSSSPNAQAAAIPLPKSHIHRTESELDLSENMALAEFRDRCMFNRLVSGIQKQQTLLYNVESHAHYQDRHHHQHKHQQQVKLEKCQEEEMEDCHVHSHSYSHSALPTQDLNNLQETQDGASTSSEAQDEYVPEYESNSDSYLPCSVPTQTQGQNQVSSSPEYLEENQRSIANIICTRNSPYGVDSYSCSRSYRRISSTNLVPNDEDSNFGQVFDIEI